MSTGSDDTDNVPVSAFVDDTQLAYSDGWMMDNSQEKEYSSTSHSTSQPAAWAFLKFNGTLLTVFGTLNYTSGPVQFLLDGQSVQTDTPTAQGFRIPIYNSPLLAFGEHTLNISLAESATSGQTLNIDYLQIMTVASQTASPGPTMTNGVPPAHSASALDNSVSTESGQHKMPAGAIAGIVVAVVFFFLALAALLFALRKLRWYKKHSTPHLQKNANDIFGEEVPLEPLKPSRMSFLRAVYRPTAPVTQASSGPTTTAIFSSVVSVHPLSPTTEETSSSFTLPRRPRHAR
ncbi:hypothetical protein EIP91_001847 [Steccherinum ochraceum]|uniref:Uncharacterized protein n=1 Tax=Steccherinum ochraceum TaxID=92696 RepID=A0A4R0RLS1_9APHY|nr:hypothetical protein EIP91_001847 [Steccherinum ochraceum]